MSRARAPTRECSMWRSLPGSSRLAVTVAIGLTLLIGTPASSQGQRWYTPTVSIRAGAAFQVAGLRNSLRLELGRGSEGRWRHQVQPAVALGATLSAALRPGLLGVRLDADVVPHATIRQDPAGPLLDELPTGRSYWLSGSLIIAPAVLCRTRCVAFSAGGGRGAYNYDAREVRGDISGSFAPRQEVGVRRFGAEVTLPILRHHVTVQAVDYVGRLTPGYSFGEQLSPIHTLVVSAGLRAGR
jgi:hypothetical protein